MMCKAHKIFAKEKVYAGLRWLAFAFVCLPCFWVDVPVCSI